MDDRDEGNDPIANEPTGAAKMIEDHSRVELEAMLGFLNRRESDRPPVLIGGWAVYALCGPSHLKSVDIDFVLRSRDRDSLIHWVVENRGFGRTHTVADGWKGATKAVPSLGKDIVLDTASYEMSNAFHGQDEELPFSLVADHHVWTNAYGPRVRVPTRSLLLLYKAKAAFDRAGRLAEGTDRDPAYTRGKLVKDRADIIGLLQDPEDWQLRFLHEQFARLPFLMEVLETAVRDDEALDRGEFRKTMGIDALAHLQDQLGVSMP